MRLSLLRRSLPVLALLSATAMAQTTKPGLWEIQSKVGGNPEVDKAMAQMRQQLASLPPAQRKQMEDMMASQGLKIGQGAGGAMAMQICITPEMAARNDLPTQAEGDCTTKIHSRTGNTVKLSFACKDPQSSGEGTYTFRGDTGYDMKMQVKTAQAGKTMNTTVEGTGRWLNAQCGNIKPVVR